MASYYPSPGYPSNSNPPPPVEVEIKLLSAKDLKNVNWRYGDLKPYAVIWVDPQSKSSTTVDKNGDTDPTWDETITLTLSSPINDETTLFIDIVHANASDETKPLIGSVRIPLSEFQKGEFIHRKLTVKRPSGRPQGKLEVDVMIRECRYHAPDPYYAPPYPGGQPAYPHYSAPSGGAAAAPPYGVAPPPSGYPYNNPPTPYEQSGYGGAPAAYGGGAPAAYGGGAPPAYGGGAPPAYGGGAPPAYGGGAPPAYGGGAQPAYGGEAQPAYGGGAQQVQGQVKEKKGSKFGMGSGLALGAAAVAGVLGGLALHEGADYVGDKIVEKVAEKVENDLAEKFENELAYDGYDCGDDVW